MVDVNQKNDSRNPFKDGFNLPVEERDYYPTDLSLTSLRVALKAYFSTYDAYGIDMYGIIDRLDRLPWSVSKTSHVNSLDVYSTTIIRFHHFMELSFKELLRRADYREKDLDGFHDALKKLRESVGSGRINLENEYIEKEIRKNWLEDFNIRRNKLWHSGKFVLHYHAIDLAVATYVLPFIVELLDCTHHKGKEILWKYEKLHCAIDPIMEITKEMKSSNPIYGKVALLKEMGRAAYNNPLKTYGYPEQRNKFIQYHAEAVAQSIAKLSGEKVVCPVCGIESFVRYESPNVGRLTGIVNENQELKMLKIIEKRCMCCGFNLFNNIENPCNYGFQEIDDFWHEGSAFSKDNAH